MPNPSAPLNLLRLSFRSMQEQLDYIAANRDLVYAIWHWHETLGNREQPFTMAGICSLCRHETEFSATPHAMPEGSPFSYRVSWWQSLRCGCSMNTLDRTAMQILVDMIGPEEPVYHVGAHSRFVRRVHERFSNVIASQYQSGRMSGEIADGIRYEDLTSLSFGDGEFAALVCMEVLEHLPDYQPALHEMARVLRKGGRALLSFPWLGGEHYDHLVRAEMQPNGTVKHILPPEYHGDPASKTGILSFRAFGWKILDELSAAGFSEAAAHYIFSPFHGYMTFSNPIIVATR